jgi:hypothetical protein
MVLGKKLMQVIGTVSGYGSGIKCGVGVGLEESNNVLLGWINGHF